MSHEQRALVGSAQPEPAATYLGTTPAYGRGRWAKGVPPPFLWSGLVAVPTLGTNDYSTKRGFCQVCRGHLLDVNKDGLEGGRLERVSGFLRCGGLCGRLELCLDRGRRATGQRRS